MIASSQQIIHILSSWAKDGSRKRQLWFQSVLHAAQSHTSALLRQNIAYVSWYTLVNGMNSYCFILDPCTKCYLQLCPTYVEVRYDEVTLTLTCQALVETNKVKVSEPWVQHLFVFGEARKVFRKKRSRAGCKFHSCDMPDANSEFLIDWKLNNLRKPCFKKGNATPQQ